MAWPWRGIAADPNDVETEICDGTKAASNGTAIAIVSKITATVTAVIEARRSAETEMAVSNPATMTAPAGMAGAMSRTSWLWPNATERYGISAQLIRSAAGRHFSQRLALFSY